MIHDLIAKVNVKRFLIFISAFKFDFIQIQYRPRDMRLEDYMQDINTRSLDSMHKFVHAMILHTGDLFNFRYHIRYVFFFNFSNKL